MESVEKVGGHLTTNLTGVSEWLSKFTSAGICPFLDGPYAS